MREGGLIADGPPAVHAWRRGAEGFTVGVVSEVRSGWAEAAEDRVLDAMLVRAPLQGWTSTTLARAAADAGLSPGDALLLLPHGARDLAALLSRRHDRAALGALCAVAPQSLKVRERIAVAVQARIDAAMADEPAVRRCVGFLALPQHLPLAARLAWESADAIWRWAGDTATDENHYSKRAILSAVLTSTLAVRVASGKAAAQAHLDRRIADVMAFEKWKAGVKPPSASAAARWLGGLRYGRG